MVKLMRAPPDNASTPRRVRGSLVWRSVLFLIVAALGALYASPNLYPPDYALQVKADQDDRRVDAEFINAAAAHLTKFDIDVKSQEVLDAAGLIRVKHSRDQLRGHLLLDEHLNPPGDERQFVVAFSQASTTPPWLQNIGGRPMSLGLDLRGGAHFVLQVDMVEAIVSRLEDEMQKAKDMLRQGRIRYRRSDTTVTVGDVNMFRIGFHTEALQERAFVLLKDEFRQPDYLLERGTFEGRPSLEVSMQDHRLDQIEANAIEQNLTGLRNRINQLGVSEPVVQRLGESRIVIDLPGVQDSTRAKRILDRFATLEFRLEASASDYPSETSSWNYEGAIIDISDGVILTGDRVTHAVQTRDAQTGLPKVVVTLDSRGGERFHDATAPNVGRRMAVIFVEHKPVAMVDVVDGERVERMSTRVEKRVVSFATIRSALGYTFEITGLALDEARELAFLLRAGALAAPMYFVEERTVGASLGDENIERGMLAVSVGFVMVLIFMAFHYKVFGLVANVALTLNLVILVAVMSLLDATLTLPGIAGIVLTVGMAVDANVLIFSRIREELKRSPPAVAIQAGYDRAFLTILDANVTTLFVALILYAIGSGPVAGFAVTLSIGIVTSMFTAIFGSRVLVHLIYGRRKLAKVHI